MGTIKRTLLVGVIAAGAEDKPSRLLSVDAEPSESLATEFPYVTEESRKGRPSMTARICPWLLVAPWTMLSSSCVANNPLYGVQLLALLALLLEQGRLGIASKALGLQSH